MVKEEYLVRVKKAFMRRPPVVIASEASDCYLNDPSGVSYIDFACGSHLPLGHCDPRIVNAITDEIARVDHVPLSESVIRHAEKLLEIAPGPLKYGKVGYCYTGTEAVGFAAKIARLSTGKMIIISYHWSHHGLGPGVETFTSDRRTSRLSCPSVANTVYIPYPYCYRCVFGNKYQNCDLQCMEYLKQVLEIIAPPENVAGVLIEPVQGWSGFVIPPLEYTKELAQLCRNLGLLLIDDEVLLNMGTTGKMFAIEHFGVAPDIMALGKALGFGLPLAAVLTQNKAVEDLKNHNLLEGLGMYYTGNPASCAASTTGINIILKDRLMDSAVRLGEVLRRGLAEIASEQELIGDIRGIGLNVAIELVTSKRTKKPATQETGQIFHEAFKRGLLLTQTGSHGHIVRMTPPLVISEDTVFRALEILDIAFKKLNFS
jgi:4-aminobutyrate aminotransferase/(S)-3-amino-2-methylpropionate transaminase